MGSLTIAVFKFTTDFISEKNCENRSIFDEVLNV